MLAVFCVRCDQETRTYPSKNYYAKHAPVNTGTLDRFLGAATAFMQSARDFLVIFEGNAKMNSLHVLQCIAKRNLEWTPISLVYNAKDVQAQWDHGSPPMQQSRRHKSLGSDSLHEKIYICWMGKKPSVQFTWWSFNRQSTSDVLSDIPVIHYTKLPKCSLDQKKAVLGASIVEPAMKANDSEDEDDRAKRKYTPRGTATERNDAVDTPCFFYTPSPVLIQSLIKTLNADWVLLGTPEAGVSAVAAAGINTPSVNVCKNPAHKEFLERSTLLVLEKELLDERSLHYSKALAQKKKDVDKPVNISITSDDEEPDADDADEDEAEASEKDDAKEHTEEPEEEDQEDPDKEEEAAEEKEETEKEPKPNVAPGQESGGTGPSTPTVKPKAKAKGKANQGLAKSKAKARATGKKRGTVEGPQQILDKIIAMESKKPRVSKGT